MKEAPKLSIVLSPEEKKEMREDMEWIRYAKEYRKPFESQMLMGAKCANMIADPSPRDDISNIFVPIARMIGEANIMALNSGRPGFGFRVGTPADISKKDLWEAAIEHVMDMSNYDIKQWMFLTDFTYLNMGIYEVVNQYPMRTVMKPNADGTFSKITKRDYRREKVEIRHRNPFEVWLDPAAPNLNEVRKVYDEKSLTKAQFKAMYEDAVSFGADGKLKKRYENCEHVQAGYEMVFGDSDNLTYREQDRTDRIVVSRIQDEDNDCIKEYANGVRIFYGALQQKQLEDGRRSIGSNAIGVHTFCFGANEFQYDSNLRTHALYPMGLPYTMRGFNTLYQALTNMQVDNTRLASTMAISYMPRDGTSQLDLDSRQFYSGDFVDGEISVHPFGQTRTGEFQVMTEIIDNWCVYLTGVNFKQLFDGGAKTAFELSQRIKAQNARHENKLRILDGGCFKKLGQLCLSGVMSELTVEDYEDLTDKEAETFKQSIKEGKISGEDFELEGGKLKRKKNRTMIRVKGKTYKEDFTASKTRSYKGDGKNTLTEDKTMRGVADSFVPVAPEYIWSQEYIERGGIPDVYSKGIRMLQDNKDLKLAKFNWLSNFARTRFAEDPQGTQFDLQKIERQAVQIIEIPEEDVMKEQKGDSGKLMEKVKEMQDMLTNPPSNALPVTPPESGAASLGLPSALSPRQPATIAETSGQFEVPYK